MVYMIIDGKQVEYKIVIYGFSDVLKVDFVGLFVKQWYGGEKSIIIICDIIVVDIGKYYFSVKLKEVI